MFEKFNKSWALFQASAAVLRSDKHLIVFPIFSAFASLIITATFFIPAGLYAWTHHWFNVSSHSAASGANIDAQLHSPIGYAIMFLFYLTQYVVVFFANTALVGAAIIRLRGGKPTLQDGFGLAMNHFGAIFGYALLASTVGMVMRTIAERAGILGRLRPGLVRPGVERGDVPGRAHSDYGKRRPDRRGSTQHVPAQADVGRADRRQCRHQLPFPACSRSC